MDSQVGVTGNPINIPLPYLALMIALAVLAMLLASMLIGRGIEARRDAVHAAAGSRVAGARQAGSSYDVAGTAGAHGAHDSTRRRCHGGKHMR